MVDFQIINPVSLFSRDIRVCSIHTTVSYYIKPDNNSSDPNAEFAVRVRNSTCSRTFQNVPELTKSTTKPCQRHMGSGTQTFGSVHCYT